MYHMNEGVDLRRWREAKGWSQSKTAKRLHVSQSYLSLLESGSRPVTPALARRLTRALQLPPSFLPTPDLGQWGEVKPESLAKRLAALGYEPLAYLGGGARPENPAAVLLWALGAENLEPRLVEALPWVLLQFADLDAEWLVREAKVRDLQNRLGFVVGLAKEVAGRDARHGARPSDLSTFESPLERSRLAREDTLCEDGMSSKMRQALRKSRSPAAAHWNLLTGWQGEHLRYEW
jgi:transcriptional regulator with XRE-family HTH domain